MHDQLFHPYYLKQLCLDYHLSPSKSYGQNYLINKKAIEHILGAGALDKKDTILEIGPGFGVLTLPLSEIVDKVVSFEIEKKLERYWQEKQIQHPNIEIVWGNFIYEWEKRQKNIGENYKVLANIPYQITSKLLKMLLESKKKPEVIVLMVQKEVAERICAKPPDMSVLSVSVQYFGKPEIVARIPKTYFWPSPKVDSAILKINVYKQIDENKKDYFFNIVKVGFSSKRKQLWKNLANGLSLDPYLIKKIIQEIKGNEKVRAEELSVEDWKKLSTFLFF